MKVVLFGTRSLGKAALELLENRGVDLCVVSNDGKLLLRATEGHHRVIPWAPARSQQAWVAQRLINFQPDVSLAVHWFSWIPEFICSVAGPYGILSYHPSLLPRHRGNDAVRKTISEGDAIAGGCIYRMERDYDVGPVCAWDWCPVQEGWTASDLWREELYPMGLRLLDYVILELKAGRELTFKPQGREMDVRGLGSGRLRSGV